MLRAFSIDFKGNRDDHRPLIELSYNNSFHSSISMEPFEELYSRRCRSLFRYFEVAKSSLLGPEIIYEALFNVRMIRDRLKIALVGKNIMTTIEEEI